MDPVMGHPILQGVQYARQIDRHERVGGILGRPTREEGADFGGVPYFSAGRRRGDGRAGGRVGTSVNRFAGALGSIRG